MDNDIDDYVEWLCVTQNTVFFNFIRTWVKIMVFMKGIDINDDYNELTNELFEMDVSNNELE